MNSSRKGERKILGKVSVPEAESVLVELANLQAEFDYTTGVGKGKDQIARLLRRHPHLWGALQSLQSKTDKPFVVEWNLVQMRDLLRKAWDATDRRSREWYAFGVRVRHLVAARGRSVLIRHFPTSPTTALSEKNSTIFAKTDRELELFWEVPPATEFEAIIYYFQAGIADRARHCLNGDCPAPYFIATKRWQKYCSDTCALPAQRAAKRKWWNEHRKNGGLL